MNVTRKLQKKIVFGLLIFAFNIAGQLSADSLFCGSEDTVERSAKRQSCEAVNYTVVAPCNLAPGVALLKCDQLMPADVPAKIQAAENACQDKCSDHAATATAEALTFTCKKRFTDQCEELCKPSSSSQDQSCNVTIAREVDDGTPRSNGSCQYQCTNRFRWNFYASIVRACSDCVPN